MLYRKFSNDSKTRRRTRPLTNSSGVEGTTFLMNSGAIIFGTAVDTIVGNDGFRGRTK